MKLYFFHVSISTSSLQFLCIFLISVAIQNNNYNYIITCMQQCLLVINSPCLALTVEISTDISQISINTGGGSVSYYPILGDSVNGVTSRGSN